jgi:hypothetical protein
MRHAITALERRRTVNTHSSKRKSRYLLDHHSEVRNESLSIPDSVATDPLSQALVLPANPMVLPALVWHYTPGIEFSLIMETGVIRVSTLNIGATEKPLVWFSSNPRYEQTVRRIAHRPDGTDEILGMEGIRRECGGIFRIGVDPGIGLISSHEIEAAANSPNRKNLERR